MSARFEIKHSGDLAAAARATGQRAEQLLRATLTEIGETGKDVARQLAPQFTGGFAEGIDATVTDTSVSIGSDDPLAHVFERGRTAGKPPPTSLIATIFDVEDDEAFVIARAIGDRGIDGARTFEFTRRAMDLEVNDAVEKLASEIGALRRAGSR